MSDESCDRCAILEVRARWTQGLDACDWTLLRSALCDEVFVDYSAWNGTPGSVVPADAWVEARTGLFPGLWAAQHSISNPLVTVSGDRARARMYVTADHILDEDGERWFTLGGVYSDEYRRIDGRWLITAMTLTPRWSRGDRSVLDDARARVAAGTGPRQ